MKYNYKYDLPPIKVKFKVEQDGKEIAVPQCDFIVRFYVDGYEGRHYDCTHKGEDYINCEPTEDGSMLICYLNNHRLGIGELGAEFHYIRTNEHYSDGSQHTVAIIDNSELGIELVEGNGDTDVESAIEVTLPFIYRDAYDIAKRHGYDGDADTFYVALASIVDIANAEAERVAAENERRRAESERESTFESMQDEFTGMMYSATDATNKANEAATRANNAATNAEQVTSNFQTFERQARADEQNRRNNEAERQSNEDTRMQNEIARNTKEAERILAERHREEVFAQQTLDLENKADRSELNNYTTLAAFNAEKDVRDEQYGNLDDAIASAENAIQDLRNGKADRSELSSLEAVVVANDAKQHQLVMDTANGLIEAIDTKADKSELNITLLSMGQPFDPVGVFMHPVEGDVKYDDSKKVLLRYEGKSWVTIGEPQSGKVYANSTSNYLYRWDGVAKTMVQVGGSAGGGTIDAYTKEESDAKFATNEDVENKQDTLVSGTNIKTVNGSSILGSGNIEIQGGGTTDAYTKAESDAKFVSRESLADEVVTDSLEADSAVIREVNTSGVFYENNSIYEENGKLTNDGDEILTTANNPQEVYVGSGTPPEDAKIVIDPQEDLVEIVQTTGNATDKVMSQDAVTKALASAGGGGWEEIATLDIANPVNFFSQSLGKEYGEVMIVGTIKSLSYTSSANIDASVAEYGTDMRIGVAEAWDAGVFVHILKSQNRYVFYGNCAMWSVATRPMNVGYLNIPTWVTDAESKLDKIRIKLEDADGTFTGTFTIYAR